jgi:flagellar motor switch protein FliM
MRQDFAFVAERALARHAPALLRPGPAEADLIAALQQAAARLARTLRGGLARLCGGEPPEVTIDALQELDFAGFARPGLHAYSLYSATPPGACLLSAIDAEAVLRLVDRAFGGPGEAPHPLPRELPMSADLMVQHIETILATHFGHALENTSRVPGAPAGHPVLHPLRRDSDLAQLQPFAPGTRLAVLTIAISEGVRAPWQVRLAMPLSALAVLTGLLPSPGAPRDSAPADPGGEPFASMPLTLTALLIDTRLPLQVVSRLEPGQVLNLPIARQVPLVIGQHGSGRTIAHGTIGATDDRVAIQITRPA